MSKKIPKNLKVIIFNGPPFVGKDEAVKAVLEKYPEFYWFRFKDILYKETAKDLGFSLDTWINICNNVTLKDMPLVRYNGSIERMSPRQILIDKSENQIKKTYGDAGVAILTVDDIIENVPNNSTIVFSDGGFNVELDVLRQRLNLGQDGMFVVSIKRGNNDFSNDSREWFKNPNIIIENNGSLEIFRSKVLAEVEHFLK